MGYFNYHSDCLLWWVCTSFMKILKFVKNENTRLFIYNVVLWIKVKRGKALCSGFKFYPTGFKCPGCKDCVGDNKIFPWRNS